MAACVWGPRLAQTARSAREAQLDPGRFGGRRRPLPKLSQHAGARRKRRNFGCARKARRRRSVLAL